jgi:hypothetical protein
LRFREIALSMQSPFYRPGYDPIKKTASADSDVKMLSAGDADPGTHFKEEKKRSRPLIVEYYGKVQLT